MSRRHLFFTNECVGLGHFRRALALATAVVEHDERATCLIVTGSSSTGDQPLPRGIDVVKLPSLARDADGLHSARRLGVDLAEVVRMRTAIATAAADAFGPSVAVVDKTPLGLHNELAGILPALARRGCRNVLGLRDIDDSPERVRAAWSSPTIRNAIERLYDAILVYGDGDGGDALSVMGWEDVEVPVHEVGLVGVALPDRGPADLTEPYVLVTAGGGSDGAPLFEAYLAALRLRPLPIRSLLVTGPLMPAADAARIRSLAQGLEATVVDFRTDMEAVMVGARAVVAMAGYNTVSESLRAGAPLLLVPRVRPSREQLVRAETLVEQGRASMVHPDAATPVVLREALDRLLASERAEIDDDADGARRAAAILTAIASGDRDACLVAVDAA